MKKNFQFSIFNFQFKKAFTLIELLIVIAIIGILAAVVIAVINPGAQRRKAKEGVAKANIARVCQAVVACQSSLSSYDSSKCDEWDDLGVLEPTQPADATYAILDLNSLATVATGYVMASVTLTEGSCLFRCVVYNDFRDWVPGGGLHVGENFRPGEVYNHSGTCLTK